jgi:ABC-type amino acid transport substrate-binding protein
MSSLIEEVDLYLDGITALPWREKMFDIIKYVPSRQMIVSSLHNKPNTLSDLNNKVCVMVKNTSMEQNLENMRLANQLSFTYINTENFDATDQMVSEGKADFTAYDRDRAFAILDKYW